MPRAAISKAHIGRALDEYQKRQDSLGRLEIRPDGTICIYPKDTAPVDKPDQTRIPKPWAKADG